MKCSYLARTYHDGEVFRLAMNYTHSVGNDQNL